MPHDTDAADVRPTHWLAQGDAVASGAFFNEIANDSAVRILERIADDVVLLEATPPRAEELKSRFGPALTMERDRPLNPID